MGEVVLVTTDNFMVACDTHSPTVGVAGGSSYKIGPALWSSDLFAASRVRRYNSWERQFLLLAVYSPLATQRVSPEEAVNGGLAALRSFFRIKEKVTGVYPCTYAHNGAWQFDGAEVVVLRLDKTMFAIPYSLLSCCSEGPYKELVDYAQRIAASSSVKRSL